MKKIFNLFFISFLLIISISVVSAQTVQIASMANPSMDFNETYSIDFEHIFDDYVHVNVSWNHYGENDAIEMHQSWSQNSVANDYFNVTLSPKAGSLGITMTIKAMEEGIDGSNFGYWTINASDSSNTTSWYINPMVFIGSEDPPEQIASIPTVILEYGETLILPISPYFTSYDDADLMYFYNATWENMSMDFSDISMYDQKRDFDVTWQLESDANGNNREINITNYAFQTFTQQFWFWPHTYRGGGLEEITNENQLRVLFKDEDDSENTNLFGNETNLPRRIASMNNIDIGYGDSEAVFMGHFVENFGWIELNWADTNTSTSVQMLETVYGDGQCYAGDFQVCMYPSGSEIALEFTGLGNDFDRTVFVSAGNGFGTVNWTFVVNTHAHSDLLNVADDRPSFFLYLTDIFDNAFPEKEDLSKKGRYAFVIVTIFIVNFLILVLSFGKNINHLSLILVIINVGLLLYFFYIGYMPIALLITVVIGALSLRLFKSKLMG